MNSLVQQMNALMNRVDFDNMDFGQVVYDSESNQFVLEDESNIDEVSKMMTQFRSSMNEGKANFIQAKQTDHLKQLAAQSPEVKQLLEQHFG